MLDDRVLVDPVTNSDINPDGVVYTGVPATTFLQDRDKGEQVCMGRVVAVGPGKRHPKTGKRRPLDVKVGEYVVFSDTCHRPCGDHIVIREGDIVTRSDEPYYHSAVVYRDRSPSLRARK